jgi:imidazolonepropionase
MPALLFKNIKQLAGIQPQATKVLRGKALNVVISLENAWLLAVDGRIHSFGSMAHLPESVPAQAEIVDCTGRMVLPAFVDSHTHLVFAGTREDEFAMRLAGMSYEEIAKRGGGIINSAKKLKQATEDELLEQASRRLKEVIAMGTGAIEIKSGYGLNPQAELKMLRVIKRLAATSEATIKATFLGLHAIPPEFAGRADAFVDAMIDEVLPTIAAEGLAEYADVFCESGYFNLAQTERFLVAADKIGLKPKIHVNQFNAFGGVALAVNHHAVSVDHLEIMKDEDFNALQNSNTIATLLPICSLMINIPYAPARKMVDENIAIALATDFNPGSSPSGNMQLAQSLACVQMKLLPNEAFNAATINGAAALQLSTELGSITEGKRANLIVTKPIPSLGFMAYNVGHNQVDFVYLNGIIQE